MEKAQMIEKAKEHLTPFETGNLISFIQGLTLKSAMEQPLIIAIFLLFALYAVISRSRFVLLFLFTVISTMVLVRYTLSPEMVGGGMTFQSMMPFVAGGVLLGLALIYLMFIKND